MDNNEHNMNVIALCAEDEFGNLLIYERFCILDEEDVDMDELNDEIGQVMCDWMNALSMDSTVKFYDAFIDDNTAKLLKSYEVNKEAQAIMVTAEEAKQLYIKKMHTYVYAEHYEAQFTPVMTTAKEEPAVENARKEAMDTFYKAMKWIRDSYNIAENRITEYNALTQLIKDHFNVDGIEL